MAGNDELTKEICEMTKEIRALKEENVRLRKVVERNDHPVDHGLSGDRFTHSPPPNCQGSRCFA